MICSIVCAKPGRSRHGPLSPNAGHPQHHDVGPQRAHGLVVEAELLEDARREVLHHDIGVRNELLGAREPVGMAEIQGDAALAEVHGMEEAGLLVEPRVVAGSHGGTEPDPVRPLHRFDLDHVRTQRGQPRGGERSRPERGEVEHAQPGQRSLADCVRRLATRRSRGPRRAGLVDRDELAVPDAVEPERRAWPDPVLTGLPDEHLARRELLEARQLGAVADDRGRDARLDTPRDHLVGGERARPGVQDLVHLVGALAASHHRRELVVVGEVVAAHQPAEREPLRDGDGRDPDEAPVGGGLVARDHHPALRGQPAAGEPRHHGRDRHERQLHRFEHRNVDVFGDTGARRAPPRGGRAECGERARHVLADVAADRQRRPARVPVRREAAAPRLEHFFREVEAVVGSAVPERSDRRP